MSDVNSGDLTKIHDPEDVFENYIGVGSEVKTGLEAEFAFFENNIEKNLPSLNLKQNKLLKDAAISSMSGDWLRNEPTAEMLEINSIAAPLDKLGQILEDTNRKTAVIDDAALKCGLKRSYFQDLPEKTADELLDNIVDVERYHAFFKPYRSDMRGFAEYFSVSKSNQVSVSYSNTEHMLSNVRRLYFLAPFLFMLTDNSSGFCQGEPFSGHSGMALRQKGLQGGRGGVPPYLFTAQSGDEYIRSHINHVMNNPLFVYYDEDGSIIKLPAGEWTSFNELKSKGLNTASNYYLSQSMLWPDVKIAALYDDSHSVYAHRYEARMFGVGLHQHQTALLIVGAMAGNDILSENIDNLLLSIGFDVKNPETARKSLIRSYDAARNHNGKFFNISYGNTSMLSFSKLFADIMEPALDAMGFVDEIRPLLDICRSGCSDGKVNRILFPELEDIINFQHSYDQSIFDNPNISAMHLFSDELSDIDGKCCSGSVISA